MDKQKLARMDGLVNLSNLETVIEKSREIILDFTSDGFERPEAVDYIFQAVRDERMPPYQGDVWIISLDTVDPTDQRFLEFLNERCIKMELADEKSQSLDQHPTYIYQGRKADLMGMMWLYWDDDLSEGLYQLY